MFSTFCAIKLEVRHTIPQIAISARKSGAALSIFLKLLVVIASYTKYIIMDSTIKIIIKLSCEEVVMIRTEAAKRVGRVIKSR